MFVLGLPTAKQLGLEHRKKNLREYIRQRQRTVSESRLGYPERQAHRTKKLREQKDNIVAKQDANITVRYLSVQSSWRSERWMRERRGKWRRGRVSGGLYCLGRKVTELGIVVVPLSCKRQSQSWPQSTVQIQFLVHNVQCHWYSLVEGEIPRKLLTLVTDTVYLLINWSV